jgi:hypothetical protein
MVMKIVVCLLFLFCLVGFVFSDTLVAGSFLDSKKISDFDLSSDLSLSPSLVKSNKENNFGFLTYEIGYSSVNLDISLEDVGKKGYPVVSSILEVNYSWIDYFSCRIYMGSKDYCTGRVVQYLVSKYEELKVVELNKIKKLKNNVDYSKEDIVISSSIFDKVRSKPKK